MKEILQKIAKLIDLKSIVMLIITITIVRGFDAEKVPSEQFVTLATMVYMFYFQKKGGSNE